MMLPTRELLNVLAPNLQSEMLIVSQFTESYHFVAMDIKFPSFIPQFRLHWFHEQSHWIQIMNINLLHKIEIKFIILADFK
jgi:hypothetical protein